MPTSPMVLKPVALKRLAALREDWPDALRMVLATVLAAVICTAFLSGSGLRRDDALEYARFVHKTCRDLANCMLDVETAEAELKRCAAELSAASGQFAQRGSHDALDFLRQTLGKDLHDFIRVLQGPR